MNKVFKVIWSEARNAYVVVSEMAKSHGTKSCSTKKLLAMLIATGVMTCASMAPAMADNPAPNVVGAESFFGIPYKYKVADGSKIAGSIAIGKNTVARTGSVMLGDHSYTGKLGDIEINPANAMTYNDGIYSTTLGAGAYNSGSLAAVTGALSIASGSDTKNTGATIYGSMNSIESETSSSSYSGVASSVLGFANRTQNANAALIWGTGNEVTNSIEKVGIDTNWNNVSVAEAQQKAIKAMQSSDYAGGSVMAIGGGNKADYAKYSQLTGVKNKVTGTKAKAAKYDFVNGYQNTVFNASDVTVIGIKNEVTADGNKVIGDNHNVSGKDNVIFGSADKLTETTVNNAVVLGHNAKVTGEGGVALGAGSVADRANAVSVGSTGANRQIINVAAGEADTDAVNVSQLQKVSDTANAGWNLSTNGFGTEATNVKPGDYVDFRGDKNISVSHDGTKVQVELNKNIDVNSIQTNALNSTTGAKLGQVTIAADGKISGVAAGEADTDAVNVSQLNAVATEAGKHTTLSNGKNTTVESTVKDGQTDYKVNVAGDLTDITSVANGDSKINLNKDSIIISNGNKYFAITNSGIGMSYIGADYSAKSIMLGENGTTISGGLNVAGSKITGVAAGVADTDAVNVSQLKKVSDTANAGWNLSTNGVATGATNVKPGDYVDFSGDKNISVSHDGTKVQVKLNKNIDVNYVQTNALNSKYSLSVGTMAENGIMPFLVSSTGAFYAANNNFSVDKDGKVIATAGEIGNVVLKNGVYTGNSALRDGELYLGDASGNYSQITPKSAKLGQVTIDEKGNMAGVNSIQTNALNAKYNLSVGTMAENGIMPFLVNSTGAFYAANNNFSVDKDGKVIATAGEIGNVVLKNGVYTGNSALRDGELYLGDASGNYSQITPKSAKLGQVTIDEKGNMAGVNSIQTNALNAKYNLSVGTMAENGIMPFLVNSTGAFYAANNNFSVDKDGKVIATAGEIGNVVLKNGVYTGNSALRDGELYLGDASGNYSQITTTGAKLGQVTIAADGKISGVAAGEVSKTSTDAINGSQLHQTNENVAALDKRVTQNEADIAQNKADIAQNKADIAQNKADIAQNKADIAQNKADIATNKANIEKNANDIASNKQNIDKLNTRVDGVEKLAKQHTTVTAGDNIAVTETTNKDGGKEYNVALKNKIDLGDKGSVTTGQTEMNKDGLKVGDKVSVSATAVTAGQTSINNDGLAVGPNTSLKADELKVDGKTYIDKNGLNANGMQITNVADGKENSDAVNVGQLKESEKTINNRINQLGNRVNKVGAGAAALAALHPMDFDPDDKLTFSAGYGNYGGENAAAIGAYYRPDEKVMFSVAGTVGNGENMVNAGVSFALDRTNHVSNSRTALAREVIDLRGQLAVMGAKMAKMEKAFGMLDETKTKLFPDVPANHWAYEYIAKLAGNGYIEGYPDGNFGGDRLMTRYEFAAMLYRAIEKGAALEEKIIKEFEPELGRIRVDRISGEDGDRDKIERVRVNDTKGERDHYGNKLAK